MTPQAIRHAQEESEKARMAVAEFIEAKSTADRKRRWGQFVSAFHRVYEKLKAGRRGPPNSSDWFDKKEKIRE